MDVDGDQWIEDVALGVLLLGGIALVLTIFL